MLAFVVLYNLNNISITERKRELATLKVLGFYNNESLDRISDKTLRHLAQAEPRDTQALAGIYGLGEKKIEKFGTELLAEIHLFGG